MTGNVWHITRFFDRKWQDCPYVLWKSVKKGLMLRNTGFIITGTTVCLFVECRQIIEEFINRFMVFKGGIRITVNGAQFVPALRRPLARWFVRMGYEGQGIERRAEHVCE